MARCRFFPQARPRWKGAAPDCACRCVLLESCSCVRRVPRVACGLLSRWPMMNSSMATLSYMMRPVGPACASRVSARSAWRAAAAPAKPAKAGTWSITSDGRKPRRHPSPPISHLCPWSGCARYPARRWMKCLTYAGAWRSKPPARQVTSSPPPKWRAACEKWARWGISRRTRSVWREPCGHRSHSWRTIWWSWVCWRKRTTVTGRSPPSSKRWAPLTDCSVRVSASIPGICPKH